MIPKKSNKPNKNPNPKPNPKKPKPVDPQNDLITKLQYYKPMLFYRDNCGLCDSAKKQLTESNFLQYFTMINIDSKEGSRLWGQFPMSKYSCTLPTYGSEVSKVGYSMDVNPVDIKFIVSKLEC
jgi:hypothetical protein